jgi:hypothetical protein
MPGQSLIIAIAVTLATFMEVLDTSIANVALPHKSAAFGRAGREYLANFYLVSNAIVLPLMDGSRRSLAASASTWAVWPSSRCLFLWFRTVCLHYHL